LKQPTFARVAADVSFVYVTLTSGVRDS